MTIEARPGFDDGFPVVDPGTFLVIRADGTEKVTRAEKPVVRAIARAIGAETLDFVTLTWNAVGQPDLMMAVDDQGWEYEVIEHSPTHYEHRPTRARKPINPRATEFYLRICKPGTTHQIVGDVALCRDGEGSGWGGRE